MNGLVEGQVAVITGAGHGIGRATATLFAEHGARAVYVTDIDGASAEEVAAHIGEQAIPVTVDVTSATDLAELQARVEAEHGAPDILVNNAGHYLKVRPFLRGTPEHWQALYEINVLHVMRACHLFLPSMQSKGKGTIINVSSVEGSRGYPPDPVYGAFKAAVVQFTRCLGVEVAHTGVRVNGIGPDLTQSEQCDFVKYDSPEVTERWPQYLPIGRVGEPSESASVILFLASDLSSFMVGQTINTDGGTGEAGGWYPSNRRRGRSWTNRPYEA